MPWNRQWKQEWEQAVWHKFHTPCMTESMRSTGQRLSLRSSILPVSWGLCQADAPVAETPLVAVEQITAGVSWNRYNIGSGNLFHPSVNWKFLVKLPDTVGNFPPLYPAQCMPMRVSPPLLLRSYTSIMIPWPVRSRLVRMAGWYHLQTEHDIICSSLNHDEELSLSNYSIHAEHQAVVLIHMHFDPECHTMI